MLRVRFPLAPRERVPLQRALTHAGRFLDVTNDDLLLKAILEHHPRLLELTPSLMNVWNIVFSKLQRIPPVLPDEFDDVLIVLP